jgi:hypothetical protein
VIGERVVVCVGSANFEFNTAAAAETSRISLADLQDGLLVGQFLMKEAATGNKEAAEASP